MSTLTIRLNEEETKQLQQIQLDHNERNKWSCYGQIKTSSGIIKEMIKNYLDILGQIQDLKDKVSSSEYRFDEIKDLLNQKFEAEENLKEANKELKSLIE